MSRGSGLCHCLSVIQSDGFLCVSVSVCFRGKWSVGGSGFGVCVCIEANGSPPVWQCFGPGAEVGSLFVS